jgi:hypothetical protein
MLGKRLAVRSALFYLVVILAVSSAWAEDDRRGETYTGGPPKITGVRFLQLTGGAKPRFRLAILGDNLGGDLAHTQVLFDTKDPQHPVETRTVYVSPKEIDVEGTASPGTVIDKVKVAVWGKPAESEPGLSISIKPVPAAPALKEFEIKLDHQASKEFPNLHSLVVTKASGDGGFDANQNHMRIELEPAGATDLKVVQSNDEQLELHFVAAADYVPKNVIVTVYDGSDLDRRHPVAVAKLAPDHVEDPNAPKITSVEVVFVDRSQGNGRLRIYGKGFGEKFPLPPFSVDEFLCNCLERPRVTGGQSCEPVTTDFPKYWPQADKATWVKRRLEDAQAALCANLLLPWSDCTSSYSFPALPDSWKPSDHKIWIQAQFRAAQAALCQKAWPKWREWENLTRTDATARAIVDVYARNAAIRVEKVDILNLDDKMIDVYFEFTRFPGYSWPFRLSSVDLTIFKPVKKVEQAVKAGDVSGEIAASASTTYTVAQAVGPKLDPNLTYSYTVYSKDSAKTLVGPGVAENFYVLQLSVVNNSTKKISIPLAAIQAEVEWLRGRVPDPPVPPGSQAKYDYIEGPATLAPIPLGAVSAYFDAYQKVDGWRARTLNVFDGLTTLVAAIVPFAGPSLKDAQIVFTGGFIPGYKKVMGDQSSEQLQNLTSMSWESAETLAANGGSMEKLIYIQRFAQFESDKIEIPSLPKTSRKQLSNIMDLEITGYEVSDSSAQQAAPSTGKTSTAPAEKPASQATPATAPAAATPAATPKPPASR